MVYIYFAANHRQAISIAQDLAKVGLVLTYKQSKEQYFTTVTDTAQWDNVGRILMVNGIIFQSGNY